MGVSEFKHHRLRPTWLCRACKEPWPCSPVRTPFLWEFAGRRIELRMVLGAYYAEALVDLADLGTSEGRRHYEELHNRFFGWTGAATVAFEAWKRERT